MKTIVLAALLLAAGAASTAGPEPPSFLDKTAAEWAAEIAGCADPADLGNAWCVPGPLPELARGREAALPVIEELLRDVRPGVRALVAAEVLGRMCPEARDLWADPAANRAARLLLDRLADGAPEVRAAAATGLGTLEFFARESLVIPDHETMAADVPNSCLFEDGPSRDPLMRAAGRRILPLHPRSGPLSAFTSSKGGRAGTCSVPRSEWPLSKRAASTGFAGSSLVATESSSTLQGTAAPSATAP